MSLFRSVWLVYGIVLLGSLLNAQSEFKYSYLPKKVYEDQLFPVTVIAIAKSDDHPIHFDFDKSGAFQPLFEKPLVIKNGNDSFYTFYFKAHKNDVKIPKLFITANGDQWSLPSQYIPITTLKKRDDFCGVLAADMKIRTHQVSNFDGDNYLVTLSLEAYEANLENMTLRGVQESGIEAIEREYAKVQGEFYVVLPITQTSLKFTYFNTIKQQYVFLEVPVELADATVTTQSDLNPKGDSFEKLKKYTLVLLVVFFMIMFLFRRDFFYLVLGVISFITLLTLFIPHKQICVKQGASLYILPTQTSTISAKVDETFNAMTLGERGEFHKIEYKEGVIGWIKNEDLCEN
jgi:hypothetical protein